MKLDITTEKHNTAKQLTVGLNEIESLKKEFDELKAKFENNEQIGIELKVYEIPYFYLSISFHFPSFRFFVFFLPALT